MKTFKVGSTEGELELTQLSEDGVTHVNIYSKARTELGRLLTNFSPLGFTHPEYGEFKSLEAFWYWLGTGKQWDSLRELSGYDAKRVGKNYRQISLENFQEEFKRAILLRFQQHPDLTKLFLANTLPLTHYYTFGGGEQFVVVDAKKSFWILEFYAELWTSKRLKHVS